MTQFLRALVLSAMVCSTAASQTGAAPAPQPDTPQQGTPQTPVPGSVNGETLRLIAEYEKAARSSELAHAGDQHLATIYVKLGNVYADSGMYLKAEDAMRHAIIHLRSGSQADLAQELGQLCALHMAMGKRRQAERDQMQALQIRESVGNPLKTALAEIEMANVYEDGQNFKKAADHARRAFDLIHAQPGAEAFELLDVRWTLGFALTGLKNCGEGMPILRDSLDFAKSNFGNGSREIAYAEYELGYGYWHCGEPAHASELLKSGTAGMKDDTGWGHRIYLNAMSHYARFLRENGEPEAAASAEAVVRQAQAVVDVRALTGRSQGFQSSRAQR